MSIENYVHNELLTGNRGGFAEKLADAWCHADSYNQGALETAFPDIFDPRVTRTVKVAVTFHGRLSELLTDESDADVRYAIEENLGGMADGVTVELVP